jgi:hypothetical protein
MANTIILISCVSKKLCHGARAKDLYTREMGGVRS